jgi:hypothetical protein
MFHFVPFFFHLIGLSPFALRPLLMASWVFLVIGLPLRLGLAGEAALFEEDFFLGALPSLTSSP